MKNIYVYQINVAKYGMTSAWAQMSDGGDTFTVYNGDLVMCINKDVDFDSLGYPRGEVFEGLHLESGRVVIMYYDYVKSYDDTKSMVR